MESNKFVKDNDFSMAEICALAKLEREFEIQNSIQKELIKKSTKVLTTKPL